MAIFGGNVVTTTFVAKDQMSKSVATMKKNVAGLGGPKFGPLGNLASGLGSMASGTLIAAAGIGAVSSALINGVKAAIEEEKAIARLNQTLTTNVAGWNDSMVVVEEVIDQHRKLGFDDNALRQSFGMLVARSGDVTQAIKEQKLAMDLATFKQIDLETSTKAVNLAMMGNTRAVKELGIALPATATEAEIFAAIQEKVAGSTEAAADTTAGRWARASSDFDEALEDMGKSLLDFDTVVRDAGKNLQTSFDDLFNIDRSAARTLTDDAIRELKLLNVAGKEAAEAADTSYGDMGEAAKAANVEIKEAANKSRQATVRMMDGILGAIREGIPSLKDRFREIKKAMDPDYIREQGRKTNQLIHQANRARARAIEDGNTEAVALLDDYIADLRTRAGIIDSLDATTTFTVSSRWGGAGGRFGRTPGGTQRQGGVKRRQGGGPVESNQPYIVGERGPELFMPDQAGNVVAHARGGIPPHSHAIEVDGYVLAKAMDIRLGKRAALGSSGEAARG